MEAYICVREHLFLVPLFPFISYFLWETSWTAFSTQDAERAVLVCLHLKGGWKHKIGL